MTEIVLVDELRWEFTSENPHMVLPGNRNRREYRVDPFPGYHHDLDRVAETLAHVEAACDLGEMAPTHIYVLSHETTSRTNGYATDEQTYDDEKGHYVPGPGFITLLGKRIPPHPAMTRYLVSHEYGHHADNAICAHRGLAASGFDDEYAELRGLTHDYKRYGGGTWHTNVGEFIANDFRILVAGAEPEFWPHLGFPRPEDVPGLAEWWHEQLGSLLD